MGTNLKYIPVQDFSLIPRYLVDQVKDKDWTTDRFYELAEMILGSPFTLLGVFADKEHTVKGFLWATINPLSMCIHVQVLSIDKEYQGKGIQSETMNILKGIGKKNGIDKIKWLATRTAAYEKQGNHYEAE